MILRTIPLAVCLLLLTLLGACRPANNLPTRSSPQYNEIVRTFYIGLAALEVGHDVQADAKLQQFTQLAPMEPAGWANWGLLALRQRNYDTAAERLNKARGLAPDNSDIFYLIGLLESSRGNTTEAINALRNSVEVDQKNLIATYKLAEEVERQGDEKSAQEFQTLIQKILAVQPDNLAGLVESTRMAAKRGDAEAVRSSVAKILARSSAWPDEVRTQVNAVDAAAQSGDLAAVATRTSFLRNVLMRLPEYRRDLAEMKPPPGEEAVAFTHFLKLEAPVFQVAAPDTGITFKPEPLNLTADKTDWIGAIYLSGQGAPVIATANAREVRLASGPSFPFPAGATNTPPTVNSILPVDFSYDFKADLVLAGDGGVRLFRQDSPSAFTDVTAETKLPATVVNGKYTAAWAADIEADGDLDVVLGSTQGSPIVLRNNGDGTFTDTQPFAGISGLTNFAWADLDADGDPDAALIDGAAKLHVFSNERQGQFTERSVPISSPIRAICGLDLNNDGVLDLALVQEGAITRLSDKDHGAGWETSEVIKTNNAASSALRVADLDNNGGLDLVLNTFVLLNDGNGKFTAIKDQVSASVFDVADLNNDGRLDLLAVSKEGQPQQAINQGTKNYHWQIVRPRATNAVGDQRINPFGVGGEMEIRSGLLVQKQPITGPRLHFGLGEQTSADVIRVTWPNGTVRADFEVKADQEIVTEQRLKGSCPFLFAYNGKQMEFVKDSVPWSSAIGLRINTLGTARVEATEEWYKIRGDQLVAREGYYDLRITGELWETYYYDYLGLMVVDHPEGTEVFVDERFVVPPAKLGFTTVKTPRKLAKAIDDSGADVTQIVSTLDGKALDSFGRGQYQGLTRDHYVEVDLGTDVPKNGPLFLIAHGSIHDTESSVNVAITQGTRWKAQSLSLEVPDGKGGWTVAQSKLGFPAGRKKTILFNLTDVFQPDTPRRVRIRTNLEIYWDMLEWAEGAPEAQIKMTRLNASSTNLHYRGYSVINRPD